jgi:hypothetical protein
MTKPSNEIERLRAINAVLVAALTGLDDEGCFGACKHYGLGKKHSAACEDARAAIKRVTEQEGGR